MYPAISASGNFDVTNSSLGFTHNKIVNIEYFELVLNDYYFWQYILLTEIAKYRFAL